MRYHRVFGLILLLLTGCGELTFAPIRSRTSQPERAGELTRTPTLELITDDEYAIYDTLVGTSQVVRDHTVDPNMIASTAQQIGTNIHQIDHDTVAAFVTANQHAALLQNRFASEHAVHLLSDTEADSIFTPTLAIGWQHFRTRYPTSQGIVTVSRIGFNQMQTQALILISTARAPLDGQGEYLLLQKEQAEWRVVARLMAWIA